MSLAGASPAKSWWVALLALTAVGSAMAQSSPSAPTCDIKLGYLSDYVKKTNQFSYNLNYLGKSLVSKGTEQNTVSDYSAGGLADVTNHSLYVNYNRGTPTVGGSVLSGYNTTPITDLLRQGLGDALRNFNLVVGVDTQTDTNQNTSYTYGIEYKQIPFLRWVGETFEIQSVTGQTKKVQIPLISSVLRLGFTGEHNVGTTGSTTDQAEATARALAGWKTSQLTGGRNKVAEDAFTKIWKAYSAKYETVDAMGKLTPGTDKNGNADFSSFGGDEQTFLDWAWVAWIDFTKIHIPAGYDTMTPDAKNAAWKKALEDDYALHHVYNAYPDVAVWGELNARYAVTTGYVGDRWRSIYSANLKYYLSPSDGKQYLQVQWRNGFTEVNPTTRNSTLLILLGFQYSPR